MTTRLALINLLEWSLILLLAYMEWAGDGAPPHIVTIASAAWITIALLCSVLLAVSMVRAEALQITERTATRDTRRTPQVGCG